MILAIEVRASLLPCPCSPQQSSPLRSSVYRWTSEYHLHRGCFGTSYLWPIEEHVRYEPIVLGPQIWKEFTTDLNSGLTGATHCSPTDLLRTEIQTLRQSGVPCDLGACCEVIHDVICSRLRLKHFRATVRSHIEDISLSPLDFRLKGHGAQRTDWTGYTTHMSNHGSIDQAGIDKTPG